MKKQSFYAIAFLIVSMLSPRYADAFWNKEEKPKEVKIAEMDRKTSGEKQAYSGARKDESLQRLRNARDDLKAPVVQIPRQMPQNREVIGAAPLSNEAKAVKVAETLESTSGLEEYQTVRALEAIQNTESIKSVDTMRNIKSLKQARRIQNVSNQTKNA